MAGFQKPDFNEGSIEVRIDKDEVAVYGTIDGLKRFGKLCYDLADSVQSEKTEHLHLEDYDVLTKSSANIVLAVFSNRQKGSH